MKILVTGSIAYDLLLSYDGSFADALRSADLDHLSVSFFSPHFARHHGGTGANVAWNLKLLDQDPLLVGTVGSDGGAYRALLEERGIATGGVEQLPGHVTATAIIGTDSSERQIAFFHPGADLHGTWPDLSDDRDQIAYAIVSPRDPGAMIRAVRWCKEWKVPYLFDPGQQAVGLSGDELHACVDGSAGVVANRYEWSLLSEKIGMDAETILRHSRFLVVTNGEEGLTIYERKDAPPTTKTITTFVHTGSQMEQTGRLSQYSIPACTPDRVVNPTGAGDALRAGLLTGLAAGWTLRDCGRLGAALASFVVEQEGTLLDFLDPGEVMSRAEEAYGERLPEVS